MQELGIGATDDSDEMIFEGLDGSLSWVGTMVPRGDKLVHKLFAFDVDNEFFGDFIVQAKELGTESLFLQVVMEIFEAFEEFRCRSIF